MTQSLRLAEVRDDRARRRALARSSSVIRSSVSTPRGAAVVVDDDGARACGRASARARRAASSSASTTGRRVPSRRLELHFAERASARAASGRGRRRRTARRTRRPAVRGLLGCVVLGEHAALAQDGDPVAEQDRLVDVVRDEDDRLPRPRRGCAAAPAGAGSRVIGSSAPNGSSISITGGSAASARARPTRWRSPPEAARRSARGSRARAGRRGRAARRRAPRISLFGQPSSRGTVATLSATVMCGKRPTCWITYPMPRRSSVCVEVATLRPSIADVARGELDQPVDQLHRCRLAAAGRPDEAADLAGGNRQRQLVHRRRRAAGIPLGRAVEDDLDRLPPAPHAGSVRGWGRPRPPPTTARARGSRRAGERSCSGRP